MQTPSKLDAQQVIFFVVLYIHLYTSPQIEKRQDARTHVLQRPLVGICYEVPYAILF